MCIALAFSVNSRVVTANARIASSAAVARTIFGQTELISGEIAEDLTYYFAASEQVPSSVGLGVLMERDNTVPDA